MNTKPNRLLAVLLLFFSLALPAATITSVASGSYTAATTWDLNRVPMAGDDVIIAAGHTVTVPAGNYEFTSLQITSSGALTIIAEADYTAAGPIGISSGGTLNVQNNFLFGADLTNDGTISWTGGFIQGQTFDIINNGTFTANLVSGNIRSTLVNFGAVSFAGGTELNVTNLSSYRGETGSTLTTTDPKGLNVTKDIVVESGATVGPVFALGLADIFGSPVTLTLATGSTFGTGTGAFGLGAGATVNGTADFVLNFEEIAFGTIPFLGVTVTGIGQELIIPAGARLQTLDGGNVQNFSQVTVNGTLAGAGLISPNVTVNSGGSIAPGLESDPRLPVLPTSNGIACLPLGGNLNMADGDLFLDIENTDVCTEYDQVQVAGTITVGDAVEFDLQRDPAELVGFIFEFVDATQVNGTFATEDPSLPATFVVEYDSPDFGSISLRSTKPLPVELTHFIATTTTDGVLLDWGTATESGNDYFAIERSTDAATFTTVGRVAGAGTTQESQSYTFTDTDPPGGALYYRLRQVDLDGTTEYSALRRVDDAGGEASALRVFPNPVGAAPAEVRFSALAVPATLSVTDPLGREIDRRQLSAGSTRAAVDLSAYPAGVYHLRLHAADRVRTATLLRR